MSVQTEYGFNNNYGQLVCNVTVAATQFTVPGPTGVAAASQPANILSNPEIAGNLWFVSVDGATVGVNGSSTTYAGSPLKIAPAAYLARPLFFAPGQVLWLITSAGTATFNLIKATKIG